MTWAAITGWGACMPPAVLTNADLATFLDTSDEWITSRTGMHERRISHVSALELSTVAAARAIACAGLQPADTDLIVYGGCSNEEAVPNSASGVQMALGATNAAAMDLNTACTSFLYGLSTATAMIRTGVVKNAVVIGVELVSRYFDGPQIFKRAVKAMSEASARVLADCGKAAADVDLVVPHQANLRIIEGVARFAGIPMEKVIVTVQKYGNMSAATVPVALVEALEAGRVAPGALLLMPGFGGGLTWASLLVRWGKRTTPLGTSDATLRPCTSTALELVNAIRATQDPNGRSAAGLRAPVFARAPQAG